MFVITDKGGVKVAALFQDDTEYVNSQIVQAIKAGMNVVYEVGGAEVLANGRRAAVSEPKPQPAWKRKPMATKATKTPALTSDDVKEGDVVYLNWLQLSNAAQLELGTKRMSKGTVTEFRKGQGIRKTVGVRFDDDPELTWVTPGDLALTLQFQD